MQSDDFEDQLDSTLVARPLIEQAKGVIVGVDCATPDEALDQLRQVSVAWDVPLSDLAEALVAVAGGRHPEDPALEELVRRQWRDVLPTC
ncbi:MAG: ANTAR domain-containing protein [Nocardioides sp.]